MIPPALERVAELYGAETGYTDVEGRRQAADVDALVAVLRSLGAPLSGPGDAPDAVRQEQVRRHALVLEPVTAVTGGSRRVVPVRLPVDVAPGRCWMRLDLEDGSVTRSRLAPRSGSTVDTLEGRSTARYQVALADPAGRPLPLGYHRLSVETPDGVWSSLLIVAPPCPLPDRGWGGFLPLSALRTGTDWGVGSYRDLGALARWLGALGASFVATLPLYPVFLGDPYDPSPYLPVTRLGWSELYIDPGVIPELERSDDARDLMASRSLADQLAQLRASPLARPGSVMTALRRVLEPLARALFATPSDRQDALMHFAGERPDLVHYAMFRAGDAHGPHRAAPAGGQAPPPVHALGEEARYQLYLQWIAETQIADAGGDLYLDMPVGVHPRGFDPWWEPAAFAEGVEGGAPPDDFFGSGQAWGFRPLEPRSIREDGYRYPIACLRQAMRRAAVVRVDHVMSLHHLYWVPSGFGADRGVYVRYHLDEMAGIVALEAHRSGTAVVGEDLGTVPQVVRDTMTSERMLRSWVLEFEASADDPLPEVPEPAMASVGTHDLPRFAAFWHGEDIDDLVVRGAQSETWAEGRREERRSWRTRLAALADIGPEVVGDAVVLSGLRACLGHLAASPARLMVVDLEDLWLEHRPVNRPGSGAGAPNWRTRTARTLEELEDDPRAAEMLRTVDALRRAPVRPLTPGRAPDPVTAAVRGEEVGG